MTDFSYQLYSSRNFPPLADTLKMLADAGYKNVEAWGGLFETDEKVAELKAAAAATGLTIPTAHVGLDVIEADPARVKAIAQDFNLDAIFVPAPGPDERDMDAAGWTAYGERLAKAGAALEGSGAAFGWHNHHWEMAPIGDGKIALDALLAASDDLKLELDVAWVVKGGQDPLATIRKYAGRIVAAHIKDIAPDGECADEDGWADVGHGTMDWPTIMTELKTTACRHFIMEHDNPSDDARFASRSITAAKAL